MDLDVIRKQTRLDKPLRDRGLLEMLSKKLGYKLNFRYKGRPKKGCGEIQVVNATVHQRPHVVLKILKSSAVGRLTYPVLV